MGIQKEHFNGLASLEDAIQSLTTKGSKHTILTPSIKALKDLQIAIHNLFIENALALEAESDEDDWQTILQNARLPEKIKNSVKQILDQAKDFENYKAFISMIERFYQHRYSNHEEYLGKLDTGLDIDKEKYLNSLVLAIDYTLKKEGTKAKTTSLVFALGMILRQRIKKEDVYPSSDLKIITKAPGIPNTQINFGFDLAEQSLDKVTTRLNSTKFFQKSPVVISDTILNISVAGIIAYKDNKLIGIKVAEITENMQLAMDVFTSDMNVALNNLDISGAIAVGDSKIEIKNSPIGPFEIGMKVLELSLSLADGTDFCPIQFYAKKEISFDQHKGLFKQYPLLMDALDIKAEVVISVSTTFTPALKKDKLLDELADAFDKMQQKNKDISAKQTDFIKRQTKFNQLMEDKKLIEKYQKDNKKLSSLIKKEKNPVKKRKLIVQKGKRNIAIKKKYSNLKQVLLDEKIDDLKKFQESLKKQQDQLVDALKKHSEAYEKTAKKFLNKAKTKVLAEALEKQAKKRLVSLVAKAIPGLNVISLAFDLYDMYTIVRDISAVYMEADAALEIDEMLDNEAVPISDMPETIPLFYYGLGAGGKLTDLTQEQVDELDSFFKENFPEGNDSKEYMDFLFNYGAYYDMHKNELPNNKSLIYNIIKYYNSTPKDLTVGFAVPMKKTFVQTGPGAMLKKAEYKIHIGTPYSIGTKVHIKASSTDQKDGVVKQIYFEFDLFVSDQIDQNNYLLKLEEDFVFLVENFAYYQIRKEADFIYNVSKQVLTLK